MDRNQHCGPLRILNGLKNFEADRFQGIADDTNVVEGG
jgi:hypothetical protein